MTDQATITLTCVRCGTAGESPANATTWRCPECSVLWKFRTCAGCGTLTWVPNETAKWQCVQCGKVDADMAAAHREYRRATDRNLKVLYVGLAVIGVGILLTLLH